MTEQSGLQGKEYDQFKELARRLVSVPKEEIDKAEKKLPRQKVGAKRIPKPESK